MLSMRVQKVMYSNNIYMETSPDEFQDLQKPVLEPVRFALEAVLPDSQELYTL